MNILEVSLVALVVIWAYSESMSGLAMFAFLDVLFSDSIGTYRMSKYLIGGLRNVLNVRMTALMGLQTYLRSEW